MKSVGPMAVSRADGCQSGRWLHHDANEISSLLSDSLQCFQTTSQETRISQLQVTPSQSRATLSKGCQIWKIKTTLRGLQAINKVHSTFIFLSYMLEDLISNGFDFQSDLILAACLIKNASKIL